MSRYSVIEKFSLKDMNILVYITNVLNSLFSVALKSVNNFVFEIRDSFSGRVSSAEVLIFVLLSTFLLLVFIEAPLGCYLLRTVHTEEGLFLRLPTRISRKHQKDANNFVITIKVSHKLSCQTHRLDADGERDDEENSDLGPGMGLSSSGDFGSEKGSERSDSDVEERQSMAGREFVEASCNRFDFVARLGLTFGFTLVYTLVIYFIARGNYNSLDNSLRSSNDTARINVVSTMNFYLHQYQSEAQE